MGSAKLLYDHHDHMATRMVADVVEEGGGRRMDQLEQLRHAAPCKIALSRESIPILQHDNEAKEIKGCLGAIVGAPRGEIHALHQVIVVRHPCP